MHVKYYYHSTTIYISRSRLLIADDFPDSQFLPESLEDDDGINLLCRDLDSGIIARAEHHDNLLGKP